MTPVPFHASRSGNLNFCRRSFRQCFFPNCSPRAPKSKHDAHFWAKFLQKKGVCCAIWSPRQSARVIAASFRSTPVSRKGSPQILDVGWQSALVLLKTSAGMLRKTASLLQKMAGVMFMKTCGNLALRATP